MRGWRVDFVHKQNPLAKGLPGRAWRLAGALMESRSENAMAILCADSANLPVRLICAPPEEIKSRQKRIAEELSRIPNHPRSYGFVKGRSPFDCANAHLSYWGRQEKGLVLLNIDLKNFFHSLREDVLTAALIGHKVEPSSIERILELCCLTTQNSLAAKAASGLLRSLKGPVGPEYSDICVPLLKDDPRGRGLLFAMRRPVARTVALYERALLDRFNKEEGKYSSHMELMPRNSAIPAMLIENLLGVRGTMGTRFLPQGSPASPVLSNLCMKLPDIRLTALAKSFGAFYTRYADDLTFSWPYFQKGKVVDGLKRCAIEVLSEYQLVPNPRKIRVMGPGQEQDVVGYNINSGRPTISTEYRKDLRRQIKVAHLMLDKGVAPDEKHLATLMGQAGYLSLAHPAESEQLKAEVRSCMERPNYERPITAELYHDEQIEPPEESGVREGRRLFVAA